MLLICKDSYAWASQRQGQGQREGQGQGYGQGHLQAILGDFPWDLQYFPLILLWIARISLKFPLHCVWFFRCPFGFSRICTHEHGKGKGKRKGTGMGMGTGMGQGPLQVFP